MSTTVAEKQAMVESCVHDSRIKVRMATRYRPEEHDDLLGDVFLEVVKCADRYVDRGDCTFRSFAKYRIKGSILDAMTRKKKSPEITNIIDFKASYEQRFYGDDNSHFESLIENLPDLQKTCLRLKFIEGLSYRKIGSKLGIHYKAI